MFYEDEDGVMAKMISKGGEDTQDYGDKETQDQGVHTENEPLYF